MTDLSKILHVDDDEDIRAIALMSLEMLGKFEVLQCGSGPEAIEKAGGFVPDLFLLDYMMPGMDGEATLAALRQLPGLADVPVIFMTARVQDDIADILRRDGALDVIAKPFDPMTLADEIREVWARHHQAPLKREA